MKNKVSKSKILVGELIFGILLFDILLEFVILLFTNDKVFYSIGLFVGMALAVGMVLHMHSSLDTALDLDEKGSVSYLQRSYGIRTAVLFAVMAGIYFLKIGSVITCMMAVFGLKAAAYMQPFTNKYISMKIINKGR